MSTGRVLHVLSQRPGRTGSGITLDALVRCATAVGYEQGVMVGVPVEDPHPEVGGLERGRVHTVTFGDGGDLPFAVPGMSDVMPYPSTVWASMTDEQLESYRAVWRRRLAEVVAELRPTLIHSHHVWILGSLIKDVAPDIPVVSHCHATGLRQMTLCPASAESVRRGCARNERFVVLHRGHAESLRAELGVGAERVRVVGAGYREELFFREADAEDRAAVILYAGKYSAAKGVGPLLDAVEALARERPEVRLEVAGSGAGDEAEALRARMDDMGERVVQHGMVSQERLGELMGRARVFVLPSFYEGLPLVLIEAAACGCRLVATALPGVVDELAPRLGDAIEMVPLPPMIGVDEPAAEGVPAFSANLAAALGAALERGPLGDPSEIVAPFTWSAVFDRIEAVWREASAGSWAPSLGS